MTHKNLGEGLLVAYADGELGPEDIAQVEEAILADSSLKARISSYKKSGKLLKESFNIDKEVTPDHIVHRIREIETAAIKKRQTGLARDNNRSSSPWRAILSLGQSLAAPVSMRSFSSLGGAFAAGIACAVFVVSPGFLTSGNDISQPLPSDEAGELVMRGSAQEHVPYISQQNQKISSGGRLIESKAFSVMYSSPIAGSVEIFEIRDSENPAIPLPANSITIEAGVLTNLGSFMVDDQDDLNLRIEVSNSATRITHDVSFKVVKP